MPDMVSVLMTFIWRIKYYIGWEKNFDMAGLEFTATKPLDDIHEAHCHIYKEQNVHVPTSPAGVLCGECIDESEGVSALLNECVSCSNVSGLLILALSMLECPHCQ